MPHVTRPHRAAASLCSLGILSAHAIAGVPGAPADAARREGDEIVIGGQYVHTGTPVVLWTDPKGFDLTGLSRGTIRKRVGTTMPTTTAIATTEPWDDALGETRIVRGPHVPLDVLRENVDQFVLHFDACGVSRECFRVLKSRRLSVQFMCDLDGVIYQTVDAGEASQHATKANTRSIGCEVANVGTFDADGPLPPRIRDWYAAEGEGVRITIPAKFGDPLLTKNFVARPARPRPVTGVVHGKRARQYDFTAPQYRALAQLAASLCTTLPKIQPDAPRFRQGVETGDRFRLLPTNDADGRPLVEITPGDPTTRPDALATPDQPGPVIAHALASAQYAAFQGIVGHYHVQTNKDDPGPAFQWEPLVEQVRKLMTPAARAACAAARGRPVMNGMLPPLVPPPG